MLQSVTLGICRSAVRPGVDGVSVVSVTLVRPTHEGHGSQVEEPDWWGGLQMTLIQTLVAPPEARKDASGGLRASPKLSTDACSGVLIYSTHITKLPQPFKTCLSFYGQDMTNWSGRLVSLSRHDKLVTSLFLRTLCSCRIPRNSYRF